VCYEQATQKQEVAVPITAKSTFSLLPGNFLRFKDENKENWAIRGAHDQILKLCQHLAIVKSLAPGALKVTTELSHNDRGIRFLSFKNSTWAMAGRWA